VAAALKTSPRGLYLAFTVITRIVRSTDFSPSRLRALYHSRAEFIRAMREPTIVGERLDEIVKAVEHSRSRSAGD